MNDARHGDRRYGGLLFLPWLFGILASWLIVVADPYHLRNSSTLYALADHRYPDLEWPRLIGVATAHTHDLVLLGGSSGMPHHVQDDARGVPWRTKPGQSELFSAATARHAPDSSQNRAGCWIAACYPVHGFLVAGQGAAPEPYGKNASKNTRRPTGVTMRNLRSRPRWPRYTRL